MGDVYVKDPTLGVNCGSDTRVGQVTPIGPASFSYTIVNEGDAESYVSMVAALSVSTSTDPVFTEQDLQHYMAPHTSYTRSQFQIYGQKSFDQAGQVTVTGTLTFTLYPTGEQIFSDNTVCQFNVLQAGS